MYTHTVHFFYVLHWNQDIQDEWQSSQAEEMKRTAFIMQTLIFSSVIQKRNLNESSTLVEIAFVIKQISKHLERKTNILRKKEITLWIKNLGFFNVHNPKGTWLFSQD